MRISGQSAYLAGYEAGRRQSSPSHKKVPVECYIAFEQGLRRAVYEGVIVSLSKEALQKLHVH